MCLYEPLEKVSSEVIGYSDEIIDNIAMMQSSGAQGECNNKRRFH